MMVMDLGRLVKLYVYSQADIFGPAGLVPLQHTLYQ